jgi:hypothetical protein
MNMEYNKAQRPPHTTSFIGNLNKNDINNELERTRDDETQMEPNADRSYLFKKKKIFEKKKKRSTRTYMYAIYLTSKYM